MDEQNNDPKAVQQSLRALRKMLDDFTVNFQEALDQIELGLGSKPTGDLSKRLSLLEDIHKKGGTIDKKVFKELSDKHKYGKTGAFFRGKRASLAMVVSGGEDKVALTQYGLDHLRRNGLVTS